MRRILKFKSIKDNNVTRHCDDGVDRYGEVTSNRQTVERLMGKRITVTVDGKDHLLPVFLLDHEETFEKKDNKGRALGEWSMLPGEKLPDDDSFLRFDEMLLLDHGENKLKVWHKAQAQFIEASAERRRQAEKEMAQKQSHDVAQVLQQMVKAVSAQTNGVKNVKGN